MVWILTACRSKNLQIIHNPYGNDLVTLAWYLGQGGHLCLLHANTVKKEENCNNDQGCWRGSMRS
jgi:hypothetical protein